MLLIMLDTKVTQKIEEFVYPKPRSIQEIAQHIDKNWRTADRYVEEISKNFGTISSRTFRGGTRGALKIVYWASVEKVSSSVFQQRLEEEIMREKKKEQFAAFDIFQHVPEKNKQAFVEVAADESGNNMLELMEMFKSAQKQILIFSGNISFINLKYRNVDMFSLIEELVNRNINIKIICRVDIVGKNNIEKILSLNFKHGRELIEIRHREQPLRAFVVDGRMFRIKEIKEPTKKVHELDEKMFIYYLIKDKEWVEWIARIFWKMFSCSVDACKRIEEMSRIINT